MNHTNAFMEITSRKVEGLDKKVSGLEEKINYFQIIRKS